MPLSVTVALGAPTYSARMVLGPYFTSAPMALPKRVPLLPAARLGAGILPVSTHAAWAIGIVPIVNIAAKSREFRVFIAASRRESLRGMRWLGETNAGVANS